VSYLLESPHVAGPVVARTGAVLVALRTGVYAHDPFSTEGSLRLVVSCAPPAVPTQPVTLGHGDSFYITYNRGISAHSLDGQTRWHRKDIVAGAPPSVAPDGTVLLASMDGRLLALNPDTGEALPSDATPVDEAILTHPVIASDGTAYVLSATRYLVWRAPDGAHGRASLPEANYTLSPALGRDGTVYVVSSEGVAYRLPPRPREAPQRSFFEAGKTVTCGPVVDATGRMAIWTAAGKVLLVDEDGRAAQYDIDAQNVSPPAVGRGGRLVFTTRDGMIYGASAPATTE
jgi:outer membrane protein assembly factor BamB